MDTIHYMLDNAGYLASLTFQHLWLVALAVGLAIIIGVPLGVLIVRHKWLATPVLGAATLLLTICTEKGSAAKSRRQRQPERAGRRNVRLARSLRLRQNHHVKDDQPADRAQQR